MIRQDKQLQLCMHTVICYYTVQSGSIQSKGTYTTHCHFTGLFPVKMLESKKKKRKFWGRIVKWIQYSCFLSILQIYQFQRAENVWKKSWSSLEWYTRNNSLAPPDNYNKCWLKIFNNTVHSSQGTHKHWLAQSCSTV